MTTTKNKQVDRMLKFLDEIDIDLIDPINQSDLITYAERFFEDPKEIEYLKDKLDSMGNK